MTIGLEHGTVKLVPYSADWPRQFDEEKKLLSEAMGTLCLTIEHIGSTAIPGIEAKPIIDIAAMISSLEDVDKCVEVLTKAGYEYKGEYGLPGRHFFVKGAPVTHHLHVVASGSDHWDSWLFFRDHLRAETDISKAYADIKHELAESYAQDRNAYTRNKGDFIVRTLREAGADDSVSSPEK